MGVRSAEVCASSGPGGYWAWSLDDGTWRCGSATGGRAEGEGEALRDLADHLGVGESVRVRVGCRETCEALGGGPGEGAVVGESLREARSAWAGRDLSLALRAPGEFPAGLPRVAAAGAGSPASDEVRDAIVAQESLLLSAEGRRDPELLERLIHPDFDEIGRTGYSWERAEVIAKLQTVPHQTERVDFGRVVELAPGVAHIRFRTQDDRGIVHRSSIWVEQDGEWRQRYHQGTPDTQDG